MARFQLAESFVSINGEGQKAGELALFLRFVGCNLRCSYCDTKWANEPDAPFTLRSTQELVGMANAFKVRNVTLTGGEPLLQTGIADLIGALCRAGFAVEIETNGAVPLAPFSGTGASFTMDYKLPSSGMEAKMCLVNFDSLRETDTLKFVCGSHKDLVRAKEIIDEYQPVCKIYLSPVFGKIDPAEMVDFMKINHMINVRLQLQLHKFIWHPDARGV